MSEASEFYRNRSRQLALGVIRLFNDGKDHPGYRTLAMQTIRAATSTAANYRAMCLGRSDAERFSKLCIVVEEADETAFWLELLHDSGLFGADVLDPLMREAYELAKIFTAYRAKLKGGLKQ